LPASGRAAPAAPAEGRTRRRAAIIGLGNVGTATASLLESVGFEVFGADVLPDKVEEFSGPPLATSPEPSWDLIAICVPTPVHLGSVVTDALEDALDHATRLALASPIPPILAIRSTLMPGMMATLVSPAIQPVARNVAALWYWPSFARERRAIEDERSPRAVVFGTPDAAAVHSLLGEWLATLTCPVHVVSWEEAELAKAGANAFNALKISYFNALADWASLVGADGQTVAGIVRFAAEGCDNPDYGTRVGPAFGGACLPKDLEALGGWVRESGSPHGSLLDAVRSVNEWPARTPPELSR